MANRREFLQIGVGATAWPLVAGAAHAAGIAPAAPSAPLLAVVYDQRFAESVAFARRMDVLGVRTCSIDGDMTRLWYSDIQHRWRESPAALAGLTAHGPLFCFAELARDVRMRVVFRAEHRAAAAGGSHVMRGPVSMVSDALRACRHAGSLGSEMADIVARCPSGRVEIASASVTEGAPVSPADEDALYTWVIAPAANA